MHLIVCVLSLVGLCDLMDYIAHQAPSVHGVFRARILEWGCHSLLQENLPNPGIKPLSSALAGGFFTTEPSGKAPSAPISVLKIQIRSRLK